MIQHYLIEQTGGGYPIAVLYMNGENPAAISPASDFGLMLVEVFGAWPSSN